ncbi:MAG: penicillin-binding protein 1C, partial [Proteobacteria bacterium]|nr:penicillin-binding protein 1C [Burkholderiales bacterium]
TLDRELQSFALDALRGQLESIAARRVRDGAVLVVDNASGEVLAYVGNSGEGASARFVDGVQAPRQAGSTLKPFLYQMAIERRLLTAASLLDDSPVDLIAPNGVYVPNNYDRQFSGWVSLRVALAASLNVPAVRTLMVVGADPFADRLRALGFADVAQGGDFYGYSLALGSAEVRLWQLVNAFRTLANRGLASPLTLVARRRPEPERVMSEASAFIVTDMLADRSAAARTFGLASALSTRGWSAVKTGTSKDMRDNWCIGFSTRYTVGVWVGNFDGAPMHDVSGVTGAAPVWQEVMNRLHRDTPSQPPAPPGGLVQTAGRDAFGTLHDEWFVAGTEMERVEHAGRRHTPRIVYPGSGLVIALDPDIPAAQQRLLLSAASAAHGFVWQLDGLLLGSAAQPLPWRPVAGSHRLRLLDARGRSVDEVAFEVRGSEGAAEGLGQGARERRAILQRVVSSRR